MWFLLSIQLFIICLFYFLGWAIRSKKAYWLISGFATRKKEEQQQLIENGLPQKTGSLLMGTAVGMIFLLPLHFMNITYVIEIQFGFMLISLLGGFIYLSKYEVPKKRKRSYIISSLLFVIVNSLIIVLFYVGYQDYTIVAKNASFEITGVYGDEWQYEDIVKIELMDKMPEVTWKQNGFGMSTMAKGYFKVKDYGSCLLFLRKDSSPFLYIELKEKKILINGENAEETHKWYEQLSKNANMVPLNQ